MPTMWFHQIEEMKTAFQVWRFDLSAQKKPRAAKTLMAPPADARSVYFEASGRLLFSALTQIGAEPETQPLVQIDAYVFSLETEPYFKRGKQAGVYELMVPDLTEEGEKP